MSHGALLLLKLITCFSQEELCGSNTLIIWAERLPSSDAGRFCRWRAQTKKAKAKEAEKEARATAKEAGKPNKQLPL